MRDLWNTLRRVERLATEHTQLRENLRVAQMFALAPRTTFNQLLPATPLGRGCSGMAVASNVNFELREPGSRSGLDLRHLQDDPPHVKKPVVAVKVVYNLGIRSTLVHSNGERDYRLLAGLPYHRNIMCVLANMGLVMLNRDAVELVPPDIRDLCVDGLGQFRRTACLASELHHRGTLEQLVKAGDDLLQSAPGVLMVASGLVDGLRHLTKHRIEHNDLKMDNVLIAANGQPVICDFGEALQLSNTMCTRVYKGRVPLGNQTHRAPEIVEAFERLHRIHDDPDQPPPHTVVDWSKAPSFSVGVLIFEMVCAGDHPISHHYPAGAEGVLSDAGCQLSVEQRARLPGFLPRAYGDVVANLLRYRPADRLPLHAAATQLDAMTYQCAVDEDTLVAVSMCDDGAAKQQADQGVATVVGGVARLVKAATAFRRHSTISGVDDLRAQLRQQQDRICDLENENERIPALCQQLEYQAARAEAQAAELDAHARSAAAVQAKLDAAHGRIPALCQQLEDQVAQARAREAALEGQVGALQQQLQDQAARAEAQAAQITALREQLASAGIVRNGGALYVQCMQGARAG